MPAKFTITSDNGYAAYVGSSAGVTYLGSEWATAAFEIFQSEYYPVGPNGKYDPTPPANPLYLDDTHSIYVVAWADGGVFQGALFNFEINGVQISSSNPAWQVYPSGFWPQTNGSHPPSATPACNPPMPQPYDRTVQFGQTGAAPPCPTWVAQQVYAADQGSLWEAVALGDANAPGSLWNSQVTGIPQTARWMWYQSNQCAPSADAPFDNPNWDASLPNNGRCHHKEPLIFKLPATAWQVDPDACHKTQGAAGNSFCTGQCPFRPDGTSPQCVSVYTPRGELKECECCGTGCALVVMPELGDSYCAGSCPHCQQCSAKEWGHYFPSMDGPPRKFIRSCGCESPAFTGSCEVDRCNNRCVGRCPLDTTTCVPTSINSNGQIEECNCIGNETKRCQMEFSGLTREPTCVGQCRNTDTECKAFYVDGVMAKCSCDCCDLQRDPVNPLNNRCLGKCDIPNHVCQPNRRMGWTDPEGVGHEITVGCGCEKP